MPHRRMGETSGTFVHSVNSPLTRLIPEAIENSYDNSRLSLRSKIIYLYGEDILKKTRLLELMNVKLRKNLARLAFLKRCRDSNVLPNCVKLKHHKNSRPINNILRRAEVSILRNEIYDTRHVLFSIRNDLFQINEELAEILEKSIFDELKFVIRRKSDRVFEIATSKHKKKYTLLRGNHIDGQSSVDQLDPDKVIINLTDEPIDEATKSLLMKGLNYAVAPNKIPVEEIICAVETAVKDIENVKAEEIRQDVAIIIRKSRPPKSNLTRREKLALRELRDDEDRIILPADKGNATVIMDINKYKDKMKQMLSEGPYKSIKNPTRRIGISVTRAVKSAVNLDPAIKGRLIISDPRPPLLYGLPKIHKDNLPMRPIVSSIGSPTYNVAKFITRQLSEHVGKTDSFVKDSRHFISLIKEVSLDENDVLVSFDVESLFTKVPIDETVNLIRDLLSQELAQLAEICLRSTFFYFDKKYYEQVDGAAMGSPLSPVAANIYMEYFEKVALQSAEKKPKKWFRYVDDVWAIWPHGRDSLEQFLVNLNSIHPNIKFTMELEKDRKLPFLDVLTFRKPNGSIGHAVYRKPTHTNRYLNAESHHHPAQKNAVLNTLINRAIHISDPESWGREKQHLKSTLHSNGYTSLDINRAFKKQMTKISNEITMAGSPQTNGQLTNQNQEQNPTNERQPMAYLPYIKGTTDKIGRILSRNNIKTIFKPHSKVRNLLRPFKDKIPLSTPGVYEIPCSCGSVYVGETKRLISTRLKEHIRHTKNKEVEKSAVAEHSTITRHGVLFDKTKVLANIPFYYPRKVREAIEIYKRENNFNKDDSLRLPKSWGPVLKKLRS